jgi:hypothetical protein
MDTKCYQCGLVNWQGAAECARCKSLLGSSARSAGVNPFDNSENKSSGGAIKLGVGLIVALTAGFAVYQFTKPEKPASASVVGPASTPEKVINFAEVDAAEKKRFDDLDAAHKKTIEAAKNVDMKQLANLARKEADKKFDDCYRRNLGDSPMAISGFQECMKN